MARIRLNTEALLAGVSNYLSLRHERADNEQRTDIAMAAAALGDATARLRRAGVLTVELDVFEPLLISTISFDDASKIRVPP
jgi:hypothetical protein